MFLILLALGVATVIALEAGRTASATGFGGPLSAKHPITVATIGAALDRLDHADPQAMMNLADLANTAGAPNVAKALAAKALEVQDIMTAVDEAQATPLRSPIAGITDEGWTKFMQLCRGNEVEEISRAYCLGLFNIGFVRLRELGLATDVKQFTYNGRTVWGGLLKPPMTLKHFLSRPDTQYLVFAKDMVDRTKMIREKYPEVIGSDIDGVKTTLSGLLAVAKLAGTKGFHGWVTNPKDRAKFKNTTQAFRAANGIF